MEGRGQFKCPFGGRAGTEDAAGNPEVPVSQPRTSMIDSVGQTYALALLQLAEESGDVEVVSGQLDELGRLLQTEIDLCRLLESRVLSVVERRGVIERIFKDQMVDVLYRFLQVVNQKNRLHHLPKIITAFAALLDERRGVVNVDAHVAVPLDEAGARGVADAIGTSLGGKQIVLRQHVDPSLIGGLKIQIGDELIDASVSSRLRTMQRKLVAVGHEQARAWDVE